VEEVNSILISLEAQRSGK